MSWRLFTVFFCVFSSTHISSLPRFHGSLSCHPPSLSMCASFSTPEHAQDGHSCEEMSNVYHPPISSPNMDAHASTQKFTNRAHACTDLIQKCTHTQTNSLFTHSTAAKISLLRGRKALIFASPRSWGVLAWQSRLMREHPQLHHGLSRLKFWGEQRNLKGKKIQFCSRPTALTPLFLPSFPFS